MRHCSTAVGASLLILATGSVCLGQDRDTKVRNDRKQFEDDASWIYNDLARAFELARETGKPLLAVIRCIT
jgi:hypothetical protein